jgi:hypothetical protein
MKIREEPLPPIQDQIASLKETIQDMKQRIFFNRRSFPVMINPHTGKKMTPEETLKYFEVWTAVLEEKYNNGEIV